MVQCGPDEGLIRSKTQEASEAVTFGPPPPFKYFSDNKYRAMLATMREKIAVVLANNLLPHFTDHSVAHSDSVTRLVDSLLEHGKEPLRDQELVILYGACYLHDIGMQYERAGETAVISSLNLIPPWHEQSESNRRVLLRDYHHRISAELVQQSVGSAEPPIGFHLTSDFYPPYIARLCHAHCIHTDSQEYRHLVADGPHIRLSLLSAFLRLADILDESQRRATRERERTLMLDLTAQTHWWRHYYTDDVSFDANHRTVTVWFDFPPDHVEEYGRVVPMLQMPWITAEFQRHSDLLIKNGYGWSVRQSCRSTPYSNTLPMPDKVLGAMLNELARRRRAADEEHRLVALSQFKEARPSVERRLKALKDREPDMTPAEYLRELSDVSFDLYDLGGRRSSCSMVYHRFLKDSEHLPVEEHIRIGLRLLQMLVDEGQWLQASHIIEKLAPNVQELPTTDDRKWKYTKLEIQALSAACAYPEAKSAIKAALEWAPEKEKIALISDLAEMELLQGDLDSDEPPHINA